MTESFTPKTIKSLKAQKPYYVMLARQENEKPIIEIPLKKHKTMEITNLKLAVFDSKNIKLRIPVQNIRSIVPLKKDKIRIQYYEQVQNNDPIVTFKRKYVDYDLEKPELSALQLCHKIKSGHERLNTWSKNDKGLLLLQPQEHIVITYRDVKTNKGRGLLYVTNVGLSLETDEGIVFDVPYEHIMLVTDHKKDKIRILYKDYPEEHDMRKHSFDFKLPKKLDRNTASSLIRKEFGDWRKKNGWEFVQLQKKFGELSYDELYNLIIIENPDYIKYMNLHVEHTFGFHALKFSLLDFDIIQSCKLAGLDIDVIKDISAEELQYRKEAQEYEVQYRKLYIKAKMYKDELEILEKTCQSADDFKKLHKSKEYTKLQDMIKEIESNPILADADERVAEFVGKALQAFDRRVRKIYDEWCKNNPLQEFADEYDYKWISYLLQKLNTTQGHKPLDTGKLSYDILQEELNVMDRNKTTLANFSAPDGIPQEHIWNNCWYDESHKIYYTQDDNLDERLQNKADSDPDHSQTMIGRRVWGFAEDQVEMFCGFPSVKVDSGYDDDEDFQVTYVRDTGKPLTQKEYRTRNLILPILREADMNEEMAVKYGSLSYQATEIRCSIKPSGSFGWLTPRLLKLYGDRFGFATIPINERVRRALFSVECYLSFDVQAPLLE